MSQVKDESKTKPGQGEGDFALDMENYYIPATELRCPGCRRFLGYVAIAWGAIRIKCPNCKEWTTLDVSPNKS